MPATKVQLTGGQFQDAEGNALALGYLKMKLNQDEAVTGVGQVCSGIDIRIELDASGAVVAGQFVWANADMTPINSYYRVTGYTAAGQPAWGPNNQQVASGATFDVGTWVPNQVISWNPSVQSIEIRVNGVLAVDQTRLNFTDNADITWSIDSSGNIQAHLV